MISILIIEDQLLFASSLKVVLEREGDLQVLALFPSGEAFLSSAQDAPFDLVLLDVAMPGRNGLAILKEIGKRWPQAKVIIFTSRADPETVIEAFKLGAQGYVLKHESLDDLRRAIRTVAAGQVPYVCTMLPPQLAIEVMEGARTGNWPESPQVSPSELRVLVCLAQGLSIKETASELGLSERTIETHRRRMMLKFSVTNATSLVYKAIQKGILDL